MPGPGQAPLRSADPENQAVIDKARRATRASRTRRPAAAHDSDAPRQPLVTPSPAHDRRQFHPSTPPPPEPAQTPATPAEASGHPPSDNWKLPDPSTPAVGPGSPDAQTATQQAAAGGSAFDRIRTNLRNHLIGSMAGAQTQSGPAVLVDKLKKAADSSVMGRGPQSAPADMKALTGSPGESRQMGELEDDPTK
jgi:hypothetical protein